MTSCPFWITMDSWVRRKDGGHVVADEQHRASLLGHVAHLAQAFALELRIAHRQDFVHDQDLRLEVRRDGERQPQVHAGRIAFDRCIDELVDLGEINNLVEFAGDLGALHAEDGAIQEDILAPGQFGMEAGADLEQRTDAAVDPDLAFGGFGDARQDLEQGALACAVAPDDAQHLSLLHIEGNIVERINRVQRIRGGSLHPADGAHGCAHRVRDILAQGAGISAARARCGNVCSGVQHG